MCRVHPLLQDASSRCLAYAFMAYPALWSSFARHSPSIHHIYATLRTAGVRIKALLAMAPDKRPLVPYAGFDERDVKDFNMENMEEFDAEESQLKGPCSMEGAVDSSTAVSIWLLMLYQMFRSPCLIIRDKFLSERQEEGSQYSPHGDDDEGSVDQILQIVTDILLCSNDMKEAAYLQCIKFVAAMNWQVPYRDTSATSDVRVQHVLMAIGVHDGSVCRWPSCALIYSLWRKWPL